MFDLYWIKYHFLISDTCASSLRESLKKEHLNDLESHHCLIRFTLETYLSFSWLLQSFFICIRFGIARKLRLLWHVLIVKCLRSSYKMFFHLANVFFFVFGLRSCFPTCNILTSELASYFFLYNHRYSTAGRRTTTLTSCCLKNGYCFLKESCNFHAVVSLAIVLIETVYSLRLSNGNWSEIKDPSIALSFSDNVLKVWMVVVFVLVCSWFLQQIEKV